MTFTINNEQIKRINHRIDQIKQKSAKDGNSSKWEKKFIISKKNDKYTVDTSFVITFVKNPFVGPIVCYDLYNLFQQIELSCLENYIKKKNQDSFILTFQSTIDGITKILTIPFSIGLILEKNILYKSYCEVVFRLVNKINEDQVESFSLSLRTFKILDSDPNNGLYQ